MIALPKQGKDNLVSVRSAQHLGGDASGSAWPTAIKSQIIKSSVCSRCAQADAARPISVYIG